MVAKLPDLPVSTQSALSWNAVDKDEGCRIAHALHNHALLLYQRMHPHGATETTKSKHFIVSISLSYADVVHIPSMLSRSSSRSANMSANTLMENTHHINMSMSQHHNYQKMQHELSKASKQDKKRDSNIIHG